MPNIVNETIELDAETLVNLATCSYYFLRDNLDPFTVGPDALSDELISSDMSVMSLNEFTGKLLFQHLENLWTIQSAHGDVIVNKELLTKEATALLRNLASDGTQDLMNQVLHKEYNSNREIHWIFGSIVINEVIVRVLMNEVRRANISTV